MLKCFIIMPITTPQNRIEQYGGDDEHFTHVLEHLFRPAIESCDFEVVDPRAQGSEIIHANIIQNIESADMVLCDMSCLNPNVFFELGVRTALNKPICLVRDDLTEAVPFDLGVINHHTYSAALHVWELKEQIENLRQHFCQAITTGKNSNSLWKYFSISATATSLHTTVSSTDKMDYLIKQFETLREDVTVMAKRQRRQSMEPVLAREYNSKRDSRFNEISEAVRDARVSSGMTVSEVCILAKVDRISLAKLEQGVRIRRVTALRICKALDLNIHLVWWKDPFVPIQSMTAANPISSDPNGQKIESTSGTGIDNLE